MKNKTCPHCGNTIFIGTITRPILCEVTDDESNKYIIKRETDNAKINIMSCVACKSKLTEEDLIETVQCSVCGRNALPEDIDENGVCDACRAKQDRPELDSMSKEDLIHMLLKMEQDKKTSVKNVMKDLEIASSTDDTEPKKRGRKKVKKAEETVEDTEEIAEEQTDNDSITEESLADSMNPPIDEDTEISNNDIEEAQSVIDDNNAPFPNVDDPFSESPIPETNENIVEENQEISSEPFAMFDNDEAI